MLKSTKSASESGLCLQAEDLQCKPCEIVIISFDQKFATDEGAERLSKAVGKALGNKKFTFIDTTTPNEKEYILASPHAINGLEFQAVILLGADEGRVPQTSGVSDISQHFIKYSSYNLLYLASSRAKYRLLLLGNKLNGVSSCLEHSLKSGHLMQEDC